MTDRVFCPLPKEFFNAFKEGRKYWELRRSESSVGRQALKRGMGSSIELRLGYNGESLWGRIMDITRFPSLDAVPEFVLEGACCSRQKAQDLLGRDNEVVVIGVDLRRSNR